MLGKVFGRLTVISKTESKDGKNYHKTVAGLHQKIKLITGGNIHK